MEFNKVATSIGNNGNKTKWILGIIYLFISSFSVIVFGKNIFEFYLILIFLSLILISFAIGGKIWWLLLPFALPFSNNIDVGNGSMLMFPSEPIGAIMALFSAYLFVSGKIQKKHFLFSPSIAILFYCFWLILSSVISSDIVVSLKFCIVRIAYIFGFYFGSIYYIEKNKKDKIVPIYLYAFSLSIVAILTLLEHSHFNFAKNFSSYAPQPFYNDHTIYAACICMIIPFGLINLEKKESHKNIGIANIVFTFMYFSFFSIILFFTYCRAGWISLLLSLIVYFFVKNTSFTYKKLLFLFFSFLVLGMLNLDLIINNFKENKNDSNAKNAGIEEQAKSITNITTDKSNAERINRWSCAIRMFKDRPFWGFGAGTYQFEYLKYQLKSEMTQISVTSQNNVKHGKGGTAHNEFLLSLSETGILGALLLLIFFSEITRIAISNILENARERKLNTALLLAFLSFFIHSFFNNFLDTDKAAFLLFYMAAFIVIQNSKSKMLTNG